MARPTPRADIAADSGDQRGIPVLGRLVRGRVLRVLRVTGHLAARFIVRFSLRVSVPPADVRTVPPADVRTVPWADVRTVPPADRLTAPLAIRPTVALALALAIRPGRRLGPRISPRIGGRQSAVRRGGRRAHTGR
ncbi:hypothetical protein ACIA7S_25165 [Streptomyces sp. NPDC051643]|uniref:hypothetical protein n=1 Tax=Streptomyces sp. NPDC051643 TaxID=3365665 RepID=UPI00378B6521